MTNIYPKMHSFLNRKFLLFLLLCTLVGNIRSHAQVLPSDFVITINTANPGVTGPLNFNMGGNGNSSAYYESIPAGISGNVPVSFGGTQIVFPAAGIYRVAIRPINIGIGQPLSQIIFSGTDSRKLLTIEQWGTTAWSSMNSSFKSCSNLVAITATDAPVLSNVTDMADVFFGCNSLISAPNMSNWDVGHATTMSGMFYNASSFNLPIGTWDVSNVTNMNSMFAGTTFNQPLDNWNVSNVTNMANMFYFATAFNQPLSNWDVSKVTNMNLMFDGTLLFNQSIGNWNVGSVTNMDAMFHNAKAFNRPIDSWDVGSVTDMSNMFDGALLFNQPIGNWDVSKVTNMFFMFNGALLFNQSIGNWDVGSVTNMDAMFSDAAAFNQFIGSWDVSKVTTMTQMFIRAAAFNQPIGNWNVSNVTSMASMFNSAAAFNQPIGNWDVSNVTTMTSMFSGAAAFNQPIDNWDVSNVTFMGGMFAYSLFNQPIGDWDVSNVAYMGGMFDHSLFNQPIGDWDVSNVTYMGGMFDHSLFNQPIGDWDVSSVTDMPGMFRYSLFNQPIGDWDVSSVTDMLGMFENAVVFNQQIGNWTLNATVDMSGMLDSSGMNCGSYGNTLIGWAENGATPAGRSLGATGRAYGAGASAAHDILTTTKGWTITGDVLDAACSISVTDYVTTWKTDNPGGGADQIFIRAYGNYTIYYESIPAGVSGTLPAVGTFTDDENITFPVAGTYRVAIKPTGPVPFHRINLGPNGSQKLLTIEQWGTTVWSSMANAYQGCHNLTTLPGTDTPVLSNLTAMSSAFANCSSLIGSANMNTWGVGNVTEMSSLFAGTVFNQPIGNWDVSNVTYMGSMFTGASAFNQPLGNWDVSNVISMKDMFSFATSFNQPLDDWDVSNVTDMGFMFLGASSFNQPLNNWNVGHVTNMLSMFRITPSFNQPLNNWNISNVTSMNFMFNAAPSFNQSLGDWTLNATVSLGNMLNDSGMDCNNYSSTLIGWAGNSATPSGRSLGATAKTFGPAASSSRDYLLNTKSWTITGDSFDATCIVLPVTLVSFDAVKQESSSLLTWATTEETNSDRFEIQRSIDAKNWDKVGTLASGGESKVLRTYQFQDQAPANGLNYYRLKMVDSDETFAYSRIRSVVFSTKPGLSVYPNPASDRLLIGDYGQVKEITLYNAAGVKTLRNNKISAQGIDISKILPGVYAVEMTLTDGSIRASKVFISK